MLSYLFQAHDLHIIIFTITPRQVFNGCRGDERETLKGY